MVNPLVGGRHAYETGELHMGRICSIENVLGLKLGSGFTNIDFIIMFCKLHLCYISFFEIKFT